MAVPDTEKPLVVIHFHITLVDGPTLGTQHIIACPVGVLLWTESTIVHFLEMVVVVYHFNRKGASVM